MKKADLHATHEGQELLESYFTVQFELEVRGNLKVALECDLSVSELKETIQTATNSIVTASTGIPWRNEENSHHLVFELQCWVLDEDIFCEEVRISRSMLVGMESTPTPADLRKVCERLVSDTEDRFLQALKDRRIGLCD